MSDKIKVEILEESSDKKGYPERIKLTYLGTSVELKKNVIEYILGMDLKNEGISKTPLEYIEEVRKVSGKPHEEHHEEDDDEKKSRLERLKEKANERKKKKKEKKAKKDSELTEEEKVEKEEKKYKRKIVIKRIFAGAGVLALLAGGYFLVRSLLKKDGDVIDIGTDENTGPKQTQEETVQTTPTEVPGISDTTIPYEQYLPYVNRSSSDMIFMSDEEYLNALNAQSIACQKNMNEISMFLEGNPLEGHKELSHIETTFVYGTVDYAVVSHFNQYRNDLVTCAYDLGSPEATKTMLTGHLREIYSFCKNEYGLTVETSNGPQTVYWNTLSDEARNAVLDVLLGYAIAEPHGYVIEIQGASMQPEDFTAFYDTELARLILINPTFRK